MTSALSTCRRTRVDKAVEAWLLGRSVGCRGGARSRCRRHHAPGRHSMSAPSTRRMSLGNATKGALLIDCSTIDVASAREVGERRRHRVSTGRRAGLGRHRRSRGGHSDLHGRRHGRSLRARRADPRTDGQGGDPRRRRGCRPGGEDLQQHDSRRDDDRHLRGVRHGAEARARPAGLLRHCVQGLGPELVDDQLLRRSPASARTRPPTMIMRAGSPRR